jgi:hypothetical protein
VSALAARGAGLLPLGHRATRHAASLAVARSLSITRPTARAIGWSPLLGACCMLLVVGTTVTLSGAEPQSLAALAAAALAAGALAGLQDPAAELLEAVPVSRARRRAHRLALLLPTTAVSWSLLLAAARLDDGWSAGWPLGPLAALLAAGVAVATWVQGPWSVTAAVATPMVWFMVDRLIGQTEGVAGTWWSSWALSASTVHPWVVAGVATAVAVAGWRR